METPLQGFTRTEVEDLLVDGCQTKAARDTCVHTHKHACTTQMQTPKTNAHARKHRYANRHLPCTRTCMHAQARDHTRACTNKHALALTCACMQMQKHARAHMRMHVRMCMRPCACTQALFARVRAGTFIPAQMQCNGMPRLASMQATPG